jgi:hypothetical protein
MTNEAISAEQQRKQLAWETAVKRLDFEIDLLWKRGLYFWTFIAATFVAYFSLSDGSDFEKKLIAIFGFLISLAWCLANMGSKYWQDVWEKKVEDLESDITGKLYGLIPVMAEKNDNFKRKAIFCFPHRDSCERYRHTFLARIARSPMCWLADGCCFF